jgi:hypothetical protein
VAAQVRGVGRHGNVVAGAYSDLVMAAGAHIRLGRLVWLHAPNLDLAEPSVPQPHRQPNNAQANSPTTATTAATTKT